MPKINVTKNYQPDSIYHVYNRGINKQLVFLETEDYHQFIKCAHKSQKKYGNLISFAYALMPNHFHWVFYQKNSYQITQFMRSLLIQYVMYFNTKYDRSGPLFDPAYRAIHIRTNAKLEEITEYVLKNPETAGLSNWQFAGRFLLNF